MSTEHGISFLKEKCVQCHGCEIACKSWRGVELGVRWRRVDNIWHGTYPNVKSTSASIGCMHCADPACIAVCPEDAIKKRPEDGIVVVDRDACSGCQACFEACLFDAPQFGADGTMQKCDLCLDAIGVNSGNPPCVTTCPTHALVFGTMNRKEKQAAEQGLLHEL
jgi:anaerobic dimethyl sulfoxide reductase subunit B (iron-sulfur subunit)